jgi:predicted phage tail protein
VREGADQSAGRVNQRQYRHACLDLSGHAENFSYSGVPAGTYTFTLRAQNATGVSDPSNPVTLVFPGGCPVPNAPYGLVAQVVRRDVTLFWSRPNGGGVPTRYDIEAGALPFQTFVIATVGSSSNMVTATNVPSGTYYVRVRAANVCGRSEPSAAIEVRVPITVP